MLNAIPNFFRRNSLKMATNGNSIFFVYLVVFLLFACLHPRHTLGHAPDPIFFHRTIERDIGHVIFDGAVTSDATAFFPNAPRRK